MNIGIDIDDTISETFETLLPYAQKYTIEELKRKPTIHMHHNFLNHLYIVKMMEWKEEEAKGFWIQYYGEILKNVHIKPFAAEVIHNLRKDGHKIYLITARWNMEKENIFQITKDWLFEKNVEYDELVTNIEDKAKLVQEKRIDLFIDDSYTNCRDIMKQTKAKVYMMYTKMNENLEIENVKRVFSWEEINYFINKEDTE